MPVSDRLSPSLQSLLAEPDPQVAIRRWAALGCPREAAERIDQALAELAGRCTWPLPLPSLRRRRRAVEFLRWWLASGCPRVADGGLSSDTLTAIAWLVAGE